MKKEPGINRSWIEQKKHELGEDFLSNINVYYIKKDAIKIFKDIAYGNISVVKDHIKYFYNVSLLNALQEASVDQYVWHNATFIGLSNYIAMCNNSIPNEYAYLYDICNRHRRSAECYTQIYQHLELMINNIKYRNGTEVEIIFNNLSGTLSKYKDSLNGDYYTINMNKRKRNEGRYHEEEYNPNSFFD